MTRLFLFGYLFIFTDMKKLPIGLQNFKEIIERGYLYVDKTRQVFDLIDRGKLYFLSRPRRFGKSMLISILTYIFEGKKELFEGLYIAENTDYNWKAYPVLRFNFRYGYKCEPDRLEAAISYDLQAYGQKFGIKLPDTIFSIQLNTLVEQLSDKQGRVVILIDEYDKPIIDFIMDTEKAKANSDVLGSFFAAIRGLEAEGHIHFLLVTGVSKFGKMSMFSELNSLNDLTLSPEALNLTGITDDELAVYFDSYIQSTAAHFNMTKEELLKSMSSWYGGYSYDGETKLYNPSSIMSFFAQKRFGSFWFAVGTPTFLVEATRNKSIAPKDFEQVEVGNTFFNEFSVEEFDMVGLLFQAGYLTINRIEYPGIEPHYFLDYPNKEVRVGFTNNLLE